jgi:hypothetical protein
MSEMFQSLDMFDLNIKRLGENIFFLWWHLRTHEVMRQMPKHAYKVFQVDGGIYKTMFTRFGAHMSNLSTEH